MIIISWIVEIKLWMKPIILELELMQFIWNYRFAASNEPDDQWEVHTLTIKDAVQEDAGIYRIKCVNRVGTTEKDTSLAIVTEPPTFPTPLQVELKQIQCCQLHSIIWFLIRAN